MPLLSKRLLKLLPLFCWTLVGLTPWTVQAQFGALPTNPFGSMPLPGAAAAALAAEAAAPTPGSPAPGVPTAASAAPADPRLTPTDPRLAPSAAPDAKPPVRPAASAAASSDWPPLVVTQFQKYVFESTGKPVNLYGYNLFEANRYPAVTDIPVPANYVLGPGDEIDLKVWGSIDVSLRLAVDRNGQVNVPRVGPITVAGTRSDALEATLKAQVGRVFSNFELSATLGRLRTIQVFVVGQARKPGSYTVSSLSTLVSALFESGGPAATGSMRAIQLVRAGQTVTTLDLYKFIHSGDTQADARLMPGDVVVIPPAGPRVGLVGALDNAAVYELAGPQEPLQNLIRYSGGQHVLSATGKVLIERIRPGVDKAPREVQELALDAAGLQSPLRDGDLVTLLNLSPEFANAVTLRGNVALPLRYAFKPGMRVADLIPEPEALIQRDYYSRKNILVQQERAPLRPGERSVNDVRNLLDEINWDYAAIERLDGQEVKTRLIPFNLRRAIKDKTPQDNVLLQAGDVVTIFSVSDIPIPMEKRTQFVRVSGEVRVPGVYQIEAGDTLLDVIKRAGGLSKNAYLFGTMFSRESTRLQQQENLNKAIRRLEAEVTSFAATATQNVTDQERGNTVQAQLAGQKALLARMQGLKASGRIALEMDPAKPELPMVTLEDGDQISVPHAPSFVGVFGAVFTETSFIHKSGSTLKDYLDKAGLTREADLDNLMVIRADGSIESNARKSSLFGGSFINNKKLSPGDSVFVPEVLDRRSSYTQFIMGAKDWTQLFYQFGLGAAAVKTLRN